MPYMKNNFNYDETILSPLNKYEVENYAHKMLSDYDTKNPGRIFKEKIRISNGDAWRIQSAVADLRQKRGEQVIGYKIGCVAKETQDKMGFTQPAWGRLWKSELHSDGAQLKKDNYANPAMEAEFGIRLNRDIEPELVSFEYILNSIETVHPLIEIHNLIFHGNSPLGAELLANNAIHAGTVLGQPVSGQIVSQLTDLKLIFDNEVVDSWSDKMWPYDVLSEVEWLVNEQQKLGNILKEGNLILTGAYGVPILINDKKLIEVSSSTFGKVSAFFD